MEYVMQVKNLTYTKNNTTILKNVDFNLQKRDMVALLGTNGSGKSTLLELLYKHNVKNIKLYKNLTMDYITSSFNFSSDTVYELLLCDSSVTKSNVDKLAKTFGVSRILMCRPSTLSYGMQCLVHLMEFLVKPSDILLIDSILDSLDFDLREKVFKYLRKLNREQNITIVYATENSNDILSFSKLMLLNQGELVYYGKMEDSFLRDELWKKCSIPYPFEVELSKKLKYYGLLDKNILNIDKLVQTIWK